MMKKLFLAVTLLALGLTACSSDTTAAQKPLDLKAENACSILGLPAGGAIDVVDAYVSPGQTYLTAAEAAHAEAGVSKVCPHQADKLAGVDLTTLAKTPEYETRPTTCPVTAAEETPLPGCEWAQQH